MPKHTKKNKKEEGGLATPVPSVPTSPHILSKLEKGEESEWTIASLYHLVQEDEPRRHLLKAGLVDKLLARKEEAGVFECLKEVCDVEEGVGKEVVRKGVVEYVMQVVVDGSPTSSKETINESSKETKEMDKEEEIKERQLEAMRLLYVLAQQQEVAYRLRDSQFVNGVMVMTRDARLRSAVLELVCLLMEGSKHMKRIVADYVVQLQSYLPCLYACEVLVGIQKDEGVLECLLECLNVTRPSASIEHAARILSCLSVPAEEVDDLVEEHKGVVIKEGVAIEEVAMLEGDVEEDLAMDEDVDSTEQVDDINDSTTLQSILSALHSLCTSLPPNQTLLVCLNALANLLSTHSYSLPFQPIFALALSAPSLPVGDDFKTLLVDACLSVLYHLARSTASLNLTQEQVDTLVSTLSNPTVLESIRVKSLSILAVHLPSSELCEQSLALLFTLLEDVSTPIDLSSECLNTLFDVFSDETSSQDVYFKNGGYLQRLERVVPVLKQKVRALDKRVYKEVRERADDMLFNAVRYIQYKQKVYSC